LLARDIYRLVIILNAVIYNKIFVFIQKMPAVLKIGVNYE
jgi:hypothetical protein